MPGELSPAQALLWPIEGPYYWVQFAFPLTRAPPWHFWPAKNRQDLTCCGWVVQRVVPAAGTPESAATEQARSLMKWSRNNGRTHCWQARPVSLWVHGQQDSTTRAATCQSAGQPACLPSQTIIVLHLLVSLTSHTLLLQSQSLFNLGFFVPPTLFKTLFQSFFRTA